MRLPIICVQVCVPNGISRVEHHPVPQVQPAMGNAEGIVGADEEHQIAGLGIAGGGAVVIKPLCSQPPNIPAALIENIGQVAGAVKGRSRGRDGKEARKCKLHFF